MPDTARADDSPLYWPIAKLIAAYRDRSLSPVEVFNEAEARADAFNSDMNVYVTRMSDLARTQAEAAERAYRNHTASPLAGVPVSIKDAFEVKGYLTTYGSLKYRDHISTQDTGTAKRIRASGAVMTGKTNTAEFGQSATTDNLLGPDTTNAWDTSRTSGGSSGGAASSVAAGLVSVGLGSDGGGSIRIPAGFSGVFGFKPSYGLVKDEGGGGAMDDFVCPGPLARSVDDARRLLNVLADRSFVRKASGRGLKIAVCAAPENRPVSAGVQEMFARTVQRLIGAGVSTRMRLPVADLAYEAELAVAQLRKSLDAFARLDATQALDVLKQDDQIDQEFDGLMRKLVTYMMEDPRTISSAIDLVFVAKAIERVGDHAKNLAESTIYIVKGADVRHATLPEVEDAVK